LLGAKVTMHGRTILVVDDEPILRRSLEKTLLRAGYAVLTAGEPEEAKDLLQIHGADLAILDIAMPDWTGELSRTAGVHLLEVIKKQYPKTKVIMLTANATIETAVQALRLGAFDYILKGDVSAQALLATVERALKSATESTQSATTRNHHGEGSVQPETRRGWLRGRLANITDEIIASLILSALVFIFGKLIGVLEGGLANWLSSMRSSWYLVAGLAFVVLVVAIYAYWQRKR
jgi:DNA-binding NtrC family response regulator